MARFFASTKASSASDQPHRNMGSHEGSKSRSNHSKSPSRWGRRPRLRRQCAHEFDNVTPPKPEVREQLAREPGSGFTEAPSSRGASDTLSAPSPTVRILDDDILGDVSEDDLWLEDELHSSIPMGGDGGEDDFDEVSRAEAQAEERRRRAKREPPLVLRVEDFECGECVGKGSYSRVFLGTHIPTGTEWALKVVSKRRTFETRENLTHLREEKNIAEKAQGSDFLVRTAGTFQNPKSVVFAMEYLPGGDLYQRLADKGTLPLGEAVAWVAQAVLAIEDLHALNIVHRDVKPENFLMGKSGTLKLSDFGFARELGPNERLFSQFGTPEYVAPEVLNGCGHAKPVDIWALGVLIYELLVGRTPFKASSVDDMYERIATGDYSFPPPPARRSRSMKKNGSGRNYLARGDGRGPSTRKHGHGHGHGHRHGLTCKKPTSSSSRRQQPAQEHREACVQGYGYSQSYDSRAGVGGYSNCCMSHFDSIGSASSSSSYYLSTPSSRSLTGSSGRWPPHHMPAGVASPSQSRSDKLWRSELLRETEEQRLEREMMEASSLADKAECGETDFHVDDVESLMEEERGYERLDGAQDPAAQSLIRVLLQLTPAHRPSIPEIKAHAFFHGVNFDALRAAVRAQADAEEEEAIVAAAIEGGDVWLRNQRVICISEDVDDNYGGVFAGF